MLIFMLLISACGSKSGDYSSNRSNLEKLDDNYRDYYEIFVGSFYDSDSDGDGMGDLKGIVQKLDYLNDNNLNSDTSLHIGGIWLMHIISSPSYRKYDVTDYYSIDPHTVL